MKNPKLTKKNVEKRLCNLYTQEIKEQQRHEKTVDKLVAERKALVAQCPHENVRLYTDIYDPSEYRCTTCGASFRQKPSGSREI